MDESKSEKNKINDDTVLLTIKAEAKHSSDGLIQSSEDVIDSGSTLNGRYDILEVIGSGGMGVVYKALDRRDVEAGNSRFIAIKALNSEFKNNPEILQSLYEEAKKTQSLSHQNIVTVYDFDRDGDVVFMTMELIEGAPLDKVLKKNQAGVGLANAINIIGQIGGALSYAHSNHIVHLDLKPQNIYFDRNKQVKILDFGIAQKITSSLADNGEPFSPIALTPNYASIELLNDEMPSESDDIFSFACVCYELLTGRHPYNRERSDIALKKGVTPRRIKSLSSRQWRALKAALSLQKKNRIRSIDDFLMEFRVKKPIYKYVAFSFVFMLIVFFGVKGLFKNSIGSGFSLLDTGVKNENMDSPQNLQGKELGRVTVWTDKKYYDIGDTIKISFNVDRKFYVRIFLVNSEGVISDLFPNPYQNDNLVLPSNTYQIPPINAEFTLDVKAPKGVDKVIAVASSKELVVDIFDEFGKLSKNAVDSYVIFETTYHIN